MVCPAFFSILSEKPFMGCKLLGLQYDIINLISIAVQKRKTEKRMKRRKTYSGGHGNVCGTPCRRRTPARGASSNLWVCGGSLDRAISNPIAAMFLSLSRHEHRRRINRLRKGISFRPIPPTKLFTICRDILRGLAIVVYDYAIDDLRLLRLTTLLPRLEI